MPSASTTKTAAFETTAVIAFLSSAVRLRQQRTVAIEFAKSVAPRAPESTRPTPKATIASASRGAALRFVDDDCCGTPAR
ncbi:hypothetical protein MMAD_35610 [Mycolicibacterium madagascariense]|uniref:Uncharacterized protein n=1 Tax=Mycolicibacterium madagascariense TaxID=212765 RepID=A0A7I7XJ74_9MYCO|nr:hypothetical protein MMAD_35610 [Mycolicibacterium madagascariense]